ncbi:MAG TPA: DUF1501 domain-containing protein [Magnetospirillaceae bacterium]
MRSTRRGFLGGFLIGAAATPLILAAPGLALANAPGDRRFVFIVLRGAMDGLHAVIPLGDRDYAAARGGLAMTASNTTNLNGFFALHPALAPLKPLYDKHEFLVVHAVASPYRDRSHFDGQDVLESGATRPHLLNDGWVNRTLKAIDAGHSTGLAVSQGIPLAIRGAVPVNSWSPSPLPGLAPDTIERIRALYADDKQFGLAFEEGVQGETFVANTLSDDGMMAGQHGQNAQNGQKQKRSQFAALAEATGKLLAAPDGPRIAVMEALGWDTHVGQGLDKGRMADALTQLGDGIAAMAQAMGPAWNKTVVVAASEFGRTVAMNGTNGTDHGTATAVLIAGGAVAGGRVVAKWPGLSRGNLYQARDLMPTTDLRAVMKGLLRDHLGVPDTALANAVFPNSATVTPMGGLVRV